MYIYIYVHVRMYYMSVYGGHTPRVQTIRIGTMLRGLCRRHRRVSGTCFDTSSVRQ